MAKLTPEQMVIAKGIAPFEVQHAMALWAKEARDDVDAHVANFGRDITADDEGIARSWARGFGPPCPLKNESNRDFGLRCAEALFFYLKEA